MGLEEGLCVYPVASFVGQGCRGNPHWVCVNPHFLSPAHREAWLREIGETIAVLLFTESGTLPRAEFYQLGRPVLRCGSGTLAAAHLLFRELNLRDTRFLQTAAGRLALRARGEWLGYGAKGLARRNVEPSDPWQSLVNQDLVSCWYIGGSQDYCLLELATEQAVADLLVNIDALQQSSDRALIATAPAVAETHDYVLRYFAPQHGKAEDAATGSANLQLADFWRERLGKTELRGHQLSRQGGEFLLKVEDRCTWVMGRTVGSERRMVNGEWCE